MKRFVFALALLAVLCSCKKAEEPTSPVTNDTIPTTPEEPTTPKVFMTTDISAEGLVAVFNALGITPSGNVAVKISTGESSNSNHLRPAFILPLVQLVDGHLVECNTTYSGQRSTTASHRNVIQQRGYTVGGGFPYELDLMDEEGEMALAIPSANPHFDSAIVGSHMANYDFIINLAHFKGHAMGGFGGVLKNQSIGMSARRGKALIHSAGRNTVSERWMQYADDQDGFLESMAEVANTIHQFFHQPGKQIVYINVMNNMSVDCDCDGNPLAPRLKDIGILASTDPVALDQACIDLVTNHENTSDDTAQPLLNRINQRHGLHILEHAAAIGLGSREYQLISIDNQ